MNLKAIAGDALASMKSTPLAIALLAVNVGFLGFAAYLLGEVAENSRDRNKAQLALIDTLVKDCRAAPRWPGDKT
jgi:hypothetical protein